MIPSDLMKRRWGQIRRLYLWLYHVIMGYLPHGTLIRYTPPGWFQSSVILRRRGGATPGSLGIVVGKWVSIDSPAYPRCGCKILLNGAVFDMYFWEFQVAD